MRISDWSSDVCSSDLPEELDIAVAVDRIERATTMQVRRIDHRWAGLRTFALDKSPVVGFAPDADGFFWLAGQGGYGVMTAPAMAAAAATLLTDGALPEGFVPEGVTTEALSPNRRSEEHTSALQSLMRISDAVFCLKKKKSKTTT